jgi:rhomboid protease GluP
MPCWPSGRPERNFGHWRSLLYLLGGFTGNVLSFILSNGYSVGASTAIFGLVGAEGVFLYQNRRLFGNQFRRAIGNVIFVVAVNLFLGLTPGIDNWGHIGGLLGGLIFAWFAGPVWEVEGIAPAYRLFDKREARDVITGAALVILIFGALAVWGMGAPLTKNEPRALRPRFQRLSVLRRSRMAEDIEGLPGTL